MFWPIIIFITGFFAAAFLTVALAGEGGITTRGRLRELGRQRTDDPATAPDAPFGERVIRPMLRSVGVAAEKIGLAKDSRLIQEKLEAAGRPVFMGITITAREFIALKLVFIVLAVLFFLAWMKYQFIGGLPGLMMAGILTLVLFMLPTLVVDHIIDTRKKEILKGMSDILDLLVVSAEAGLSLDAAMSRVVEKRRGALPNEFANALQEMRLGRSRADSLKDMAQRCGVQEVRMFTGAIIQAESLGVSIAQVLRTQADVHRERRSQRVRELAAKLPVKMLFPMLLFIFPAIFVVLLGPSMMSIYRALSGIGQ